MFLIPHMVLFTDWQSQILLFSLAWIYQQQPHSCIKVNNGRQIALKESRAGERFRRDASHCIIWTRAVLTRMLLIGNSHVSKRHNTNEHRYPARNCTTSTADRTRYFPLPSKSWWLWNLSFETKHKVRKIETGRLDATTDNSTVCVTREYRAQ